MKINIAAYGIAKDILGGSEISLETADHLTVGTLLTQLKQRYPDFQKLNSLVVAINANYAEADQRITERDEVVLIPPVSGG